MPGRHVSITSAIKAIPLLHNRMYTCRGRLPSHSFDARFPDKEGLVLFCEPIFLVTTSTPVGHGTEPSTFPRIWSFGWSDCLGFRFSLRWGFAGANAIEYFKGLPSNIGVSEDLDNEAEWIVDITTQADRQGRYYCFSPILLSSECSIVPV